MAEVTRKSEENGHWVSHFEHYLMTAPFLPALKLATSEEESEAELRNEKDAKS